MHLCRYLKTNLRCLSEINFLFVKSDTQNFKNIRQLISPKHLNPGHYNLSLGTELISESLFCRDLRVRWADQDLLDNLENLQVSHLIDKICTCIYHFNPLLLPEMIGLVRFYNK